MRPYVIRQGDYLTRLAHSMGFDAVAVWADDANRALRERRPNPNVLCPGDILQVPAEPASTPLRLPAGQHSRYRVKARRLKIEVVFRDEACALANAPYVVDGLAERVTGTSDGDGRVCFDVPVHARAVRVVFFERHLAFDVRVGDLDPIEEDSGVRQRLAHLGFDGWALGAAAALPRPPTSDGDATAIRAFQQTQTIEPTGVLDDATRAALKKAHGG